MLFLEADIKIGIFPIPTAYRSGFRIFQTKSGWLDNLISNKKRMIDRKFISATERNIFIHLSWGPIILNSYLSIVN